MCWATAIRLVSNRKLFTVHYLTQDWRLQTDPPYLVRRKAKALPVDLQEHGDKAHQIDWKSSVLLNLVTQTSYILTVAACQREDLSSVGNPELLSKGVVEV